MSLVQLQRAFQAHLLDGDDRIVPLVAPAMRRGLPVYTHAYRATLRAALRDVFEKTLLWLGEDEFDHIAAAYVEATPSSSWTLSDYGADFSAFLAEAHPDDPEIAELAWLDWALRHAFAAAAVPPFDPAALAGVDWEQAELDLAAHAGFRIITTNCITVWNSLPDTPAASAPLEQPLGLVVWRDGLSPQFRSAAVAEITGLLAIAQGQRFGQVCAVLAEAGHGDPEQIGALLSRWLNDGIAAVRAGSIEQPAAVDQP